MLAGAGSDVSAWPASCSMQPVEQTRRLPMLKTIDIRRFAAVATSLRVLASAGAASAQEHVAHESAATPVRVEPRHSINLGVGMAWAAPSITYEHLFPGGHGLLIGANAFYSLLVDDAMGAGGSVGYRWHWNGRQDSGFLGLHAGFDRDLSPVRITIDEMTEERSVNISTFYLVANIGKRWLVRDNINVTARIGSGVALRYFDTDADDIEPVVGVMQDIIGNFPMTVDGELSVGYTF
jgi:hypothetical protein